MIELSTLQLKVELRGAQLADPEMGSALSLFRRAANILARLEDALVFKADNPHADQLPPDTEAASMAKRYAAAKTSHGLIDVGYVLSDRTLASNGGNTLVKAVTEAISHLETNGHFGPFCCRAWATTVLRTGATAELPDDHKSPRKIR